MTGHAERPVDAGPRWRDLLRSAIRDPDQLIDALQLPEELREGARRAHSLFPVVVPRPFLARIRPGDPDDPLLRQVLPIVAEDAAPQPGWSTDPVGELPSLRAPGLIHKYHGRALLIATGVCAVACRYCFRRHFPYDESPSSLDSWNEALDVIRDDDSIQEIILSGGDPLMRGDDWLAQLCARLEAIPHLRRIRIHTRLPIVIPERVDDALLGWLSTTRLAPTVVVHSNHPAELDDHCGNALLRLVKAGIPVLNQSVLLRGINDDARVLEELSLRLLDLRVMPYYLSVLDPVQGAAHFDASAERGMAIIAALRKRLPGFGVPRFVREVPGAAHKVEFASSDGNRTPIQD